MGRRATGTVEPLRSAIRLKFTWQGQRRVETLDLEPNAANIKAARRILAQVCEAIAVGTYDPARFFPKAAETSAQTFEAYGDEWLKTLTLAKSTRRSYRSALRGTWYPAFGAKRLAQLRHSDIAKAIGAKKAQASGKTINNLLVPLREVLRAAVLDGEIARSPAEGVRNLPHQKPEPDPLDLEEMALVLAHMASRFDPQVANYFEFAFNTGMRPSELIALRWSRIDLRRGKARVDVARVDWEEKGTKTNTIREVDLNDAATAVLARQKASSFLAGEEVFLNPATGIAWADEQVQRRRYWNPTLKALGIRQRDAYQVRHTYASLLLTGGVNPAYIARQLGHSKITTTLNTYARWIESADKGAEARKANEILSMNRPRARGGH